MDLKTLVLGKDFLFVLLTAGFFSFLMFIVFSKMLRQNRVEGEVQVNAVNNQILNDISSLERKIASRNVLFEKKIELILQRQSDNHSEIIRRLEELEDELVNQQITRHKLNSLLAANTSEN